MDLTKAEATVMRAIAVTHEEASANKIMDLAKLGSGRFYPLVERLKAQGLVADHKEALDSSENRPARHLYSLTTSGNSKLIAELALPPAETQELRAGKTCRLQVVPTWQMLAIALKCHPTGDSMRDDLIIEGGQRHDFMIKGLLFNDDGSYTFSGTALDVTRWLDFTAKIKKYAQHPADSELDMVFGTVKFSKR